MSISFRMHNQFIPRTNKPRTNVTKYFNCTLLIDLRCSRGTYAVAQPPLTHHFGRIDYDDPSEAVCY